MSRLSGVGHGDSGRATAEVALRGHDLVVVLADGQAGSAPGVKVAARLDSTAGALVAADRPVLLEGLGAVDAGGVCARAARNVVGAAVALDGAEALGLRRGVVGAEVLDDVILSKRQRDSRAESEEDVPQPEGCASSRRRRGSCCRWAGRYPKW
jgi:hypothetical protein